MSFNESKEDLIKETAGGPLETAARDAGDTRAAGEAVLEAVSDSPENAGFGDLPE